MKNITKELMEWYQENARILPWRSDPTPYHVWISEIMLQQTRVEAVKEYYRRFLENIPDVKSLAKIDEEELMKLWQGLGYYNRARNLQKAAWFIEEECGGVFPDYYEGLLKMPGVGEYTAGAIASMAFNRRVPAVDGNVYRIYTRLMADDGDITKTPTKRKIREEIEKIMPESQFGAFNQAWMDLGATVCLPNGKPLCEKCPLQSFCEAKKQGNPQEYPNKPAKKARKIEKRTIIILECQGKYMIRKREEEGLLAGLWEFPSYDGYLGLEEMSEILKEEGYCYDSMELLGKGKHIFSHVEWHMLGYLIHLKEWKRSYGTEGIYLDMETIQEKYSVPSAFSYYMKKLQEYHNKQVLDS